MNESDKLFKHLNRDAFFQIGYNNSKYHYIILHEFLSTYWEHKNINAFTIAHNLYHKSNSLLNSENDPEFIKDKDMYIRQIDLMSILHLNYKHKRTSLKDVQFYLNHKNIEEDSIMSELCIRPDQFDEILSFCKNDVSSIYKLYKLVRGSTNNPIYKGCDELKIRNNIKKEFGINCLNYPNVKIGEQLILSLYCRNTGKDWGEVKEMRTNRQFVDLIDCIPSFCHFNSKQFKDMLELIKIKTVDTSLMNFETSVIFHNIKLSVGCGGLHGNIKSGIYKSDDKNVILSLDVESLYPSIAKVSKLYPEHLGIEFNDLYYPFVDMRLNEKHKSNGDKTLIKTLKVVTNCVFGKSNEPKSFLLDQKYFLTTTFTGQILTCM